MILCSILLNQNMDKLSAMATFVAVADAGSFTAAADALALPKARVSQRVAALEAELGVRLIHRTTRSLNLTADGAAYLDQCRSVLHQIEDIEGGLREGAAEPRGRLRVEALVSVARWIVAPRIHEFHALHPRIQLRLGASDRISHLLEDGIDCAIRGGRLQDSSNVSRQLCEIELGLYASAEYLALHPRVRLPDDLHGHTRLSWFPAESHPFTWKLQSIDAQTHVSSSDGIVFDDPDVAMAACMAGAGICPGAPFAVAQHVRAGRLLPVLPQWSFAPRPISLLYPGSRHLSGRVRCFVDWFVALMEQTSDIRLTPWTLAQALAGEEGASPQGRRKRVPPRFHGGLGKSSSA
jgi:LysR family transcriptional regulator for bpeEF and oprC